MTAQPAKWGFTLVEALVSVTILAVGIVGVLEGFSLSSRSGSEAMRLSKAAEIAHRQLVLAVSSHEQDAESEGVEGPYTWKLEVSDLSEGLRLASVTVKWVDRKGLGTFELSEVFSATSAMEVRR